MGIYIWGIVDTEYSSKASIRVTEICINSWFHFTHGKHYRCQSETVVLIKFLKFLPDGEDERLYVVIGECSTCVMLLPVVFINGVEIEGNFSTKGFYDITFRFRGMNISNRKSLKINSICKRICRRFCNFRILRDDQFIGLELLDGFAGCVDNYIPRILI